MKVFFKIIALSLVILFAPITIFSLVTNFFKKETKNNILSKYDFVASADVPGSGEGEGVEGACESASSESCCEGQGEGK